jgi:predicted Zn-dependent protease
MGEAAHVRLQSEAIRLEGDGYRSLFAGDEFGARDLLREAAAAYRRSWEVAPPRSFGRLVGMLKAAVIAGGGEQEAAYVRGQLAREGDSPASWYALGIAALLEGDDGLARRAAARMRAGSAAFGRAADVLKALADRDGERYAHGVRAILADFEKREEHLTGVRIADTALMFELLAQRRGLGAHPTSELLPSLAH